MVAALTSGARKRGRREGSHPASIVCGSHGGVRCGGVSKKRGGAEGWTCCEGGVSVTCPVHSTHVHILTRVLTYVYALLHHYAQARPLCWWREPWAEDSRWPPP